MADIGHIRNRTGKLRRQSPVDRASGTNRLSQSSWTPDSSPVISSSCLVLDATGASRPEISSPSCEILLWRRLIWLRRAVARALNNESSDASSVLTVPHAWPRRQVGEAQSATIWARSAQLSLESTAGTRCGTVCLRGHQGAFWLQRVRLGD